jgi:TonB-dependent starch-binding outer membrane protein SusC
MKHKLLFKKSLSILLLLAGTITSAWAQDRTVTGKVTAFSDNAPIPGVNIKVVGTNTGTVTDISGNYKIAVENGSKISFSFVGYTTEEVEVKNQTIINISLAEDIATLSEIVVVGYGTQKKSDLTGSVTSVSAKDFNAGQVTTPDQLINGKVSGVQITSGGGAPGAGSQIRIRGGSSLNASNDPLFVIDGVPVDNSSIAGSPNPLSMINPNDIETFTVLKDASATAIYGSRASNGVIIITTKKGQKGQGMKVDFSTLTSLSTIARKVDVLGGDEFKDLVRREGGEARAALLGNENTNWQDQIYRNALASDNNLSVSGSYKNVPYRVSLNYLNQNGILRTGNLDRTSAAVNFTPTFLDNHLKVDVNLRGAMTNSRFANEGAIGSAISMAPTQPVNMSDQRFGGYFEWLDGNGLPIPVATKNPLSLLLQRSDVSTVKRSIGNAQFDYIFHGLPDLRANLNVGYDYSESAGSVEEPSSMASVFVQKGSLREYSQSKMNQLVDFYLNYNKDLKSIKSRIDLTAGTSYQDFRITNPSYPTINEEGTILNPAVTNLLQGNNIFINQYRLFSVFGRANYSLNNKYLLTATLRMDGSSRFAPENRWGVFPSLAGAWKINEEAFLKNSSIISDLKLRVGYGVTGQQDIGPYFPFLPKYTPSNETAMYRFGNEYYFMLRPDGYDRNIKWEETATYNVGLDFGILKGKVNGSVEYFQRYTKDLLAVIALPAGTNLTNELFTNVGSLEIKGLEANLNFNLINTRKVRWDLGVNATFIDNVITNLSKVATENTVGYPTGGISGGVGNTIQVNTVGFPRNSFFVYQQVYDEAGKPIEGLYVDQNGDGMINQQDLYRYQRPDPRVFIGLSNGFSYDKFRLDFVLRGNFGNYMYNNVKSTRGTHQTFMANIPGNAHPNVLETNFRNAQFFSDYYMENASFVRMENINLSYNLSDLINNKASLRVSASVQNAFVITKYSGVDPEIARGIDNNFYPRPRIFALGVNVGF